MMKAQLGISQWSLPGANGYSVEMARELGFAGLQLELGSYEKGYALSQKFLQQRYIQDSRSTGVKLLPIALNTLCDHGFVKGFDTPDGKIALETLRIGVETAAIMGVEGVTVPSFFCNMITCKEDYNHTVEALKLVCALARDQGLTVYTENILNAEKLQQLFDEVSCPNLQLLFDSQNYAVFNKPYALSVLQQYYDRCGNYIHLKDGGGMGSMLLGTGESPFAAIMAELKQRCYDGMLVFENNYAELPLRAGQSNYYDNIRKDIRTVKEMLG